MAWQVIENPKAKKYRIFSTIVDNFIIFDQEVELSEIKAFWKEEFGRHGVNNLESMLDRKPVHWNTWEEALRIIKNVHG